MKGIVFSEFLEFVEQRFSIEQAQDMIDACELESGGAYTSVGTYDHREMIQLLGALSSQVDVDVASLQVPVRGSSHGGLRREVQRFR